MKEFYQEFVDYVNFYIPFNIVRKSFVLWLVGARKLVTFQSEILTTVYELRFCRQKVLATEKNNRFIRIRIYSCFKWQDLNLWTGQIWFSNLFSNLKFFNSWLIFTVHWYRYHLSRENMNMFTMKRSLVISVWKSAFVARDKLHEALEQLISCGIFWNSRILNEVIEIRN